MNADDAVGRERVIHEAESWLRTPFHVDACLKGVGVDCGRLLSAVYGAAGFAVPSEMGHFAKDWSAHTTEERYLNFVKAYAHLVSTQEPGDIVMVKMVGSKVFSHGAIIINWPNVIHAYWGRGVELADATKGLLGGGEKLFFSPFGTS